MDEQNDMVYGSHAQHSAKREGPKPRAPRDCEPPAWSAGRPVEPGLYVGFSTIRAEMDRPEEPTIYSFDGTNFQHWTGWYDHAVDRWIKLNLPTVGDAKLSSTRGTTD